VIRASDGKLYLSNFAHFFPCEQPRPDVKGSHLIQLFRPEFVDQYHLSLSCDAYSSFAENQLSEVHNQQVDDASTYLTNVLVPEFARELDGWVFSSYSSRFFISLLHSRGINVRHLGMVRHHVKSPVWRWHLIIEMLARTVKCMMRASMRYHVRRSYQQHRAGEAQLVSSAVDILNLTLGTGQEVEQFWRYDLQPLLVAKFDHSLDEDEKDYDIFDLRYYATYPHPDIKEGSDGRIQILHIVSQSAGVKWRKQIRNLLFKGEAAFDTVFPVDEGEFPFFKQLIRTVSLFSYAQGYLLYRKAQYKAEIEKPEEAVHLYMLSAEFFERAFWQGYHSTNLYTYLADTHSAAGHLEEADIYFARAVSRSEQDPIILLKYAVFLEASHYLDEAESCYLSILQRDIEQKTALCLYADFLHVQHQAYVDAQHFYLATIRTLSPLVAACNNYACMSLKMANDLAKDEQHQFPIGSMRERRGGFLDRAGAYFELALKLNSKHPQLLRNVGFFCKHYGRRTVILGDRKHTLKGAQEADHERIQEK